MAFKTKSKNRLLVDERQTLDAKHNNILLSFTENKDNIESLYSQLSNLTATILQLNEENLKSPILNMGLQKQIWDCDDKKKKLEEEINRIENNIDENQYMLKTGKLLSNYYKIIDEEKKIACNGSSSSNIIIEPTIQPSNTINGKKRTIVDWFQPSNISVIENLDTGKKTIQLNKKKTLDKETKDSTKDFTKDSTKDFTKDFTKDSKETKETGEVVEDIIVEKKNNTIMLQNKDTIYENYMKLIDKNYITINNENVDIFDSCPICVIEMLLNNNTGQLICPKCGFLENIIVDSDKPSFKEPPKEMTSFCYKRINHLNEFLAQFQAKETTDIHEDVYNEILMEIKKERITNMALITPDKMRSLLKKIRKNDYYEHIPYIINQLNGLPAPVIAPEIEEIIRGMFKGIQIPFEKYCPYKRKNFLSYNYVMYKFFELLELDEYLTCFQLLKSRTKLHQQDQIWKNICKDLNWEFIKSL
jgi:hypothetical protein